MKSGQPMQTRFSTAKTCRCLSIQMALFPFSGLMLMRSNMAQISSCLVKSGSHNWINLSLAHSKWRAWKGRCMRFLASKIRHVVLLRKRKKISCWLTSTQSLKSSERDALRRSRCSNARASIASIVLRRLWSMVSTKFWRSSIQPRCHLCQLTSQVTHLRQFSERSRACLNFSFWSRRSRDHAGSHLKIQRSLVTSDARGVNRRSSSLIQRTVFVLLRTSTGRALHLCLWLFQQSWLAHIRTRKRSPWSRALCKTKWTKTVQRARRLSRVSLCCAS